MTLEIDLTGRVAVVTGGGAGIGGAVSDMLAAAGAHVVVADIDEDVQRLATTVLDARGHVDVLVNNVGHYVRATPFTESGPVHWDALHAVNLLHVFACTRAFLPAMVEHGAGSIVNVSSVEGLRGYPADPVYGAYKAAVAHFTRCLALEVAPHGIRVNAIAPDVTQSLQVDYEAMVPEDLRDRWPVWVPVGHVGEPEDSAAVVLFLASQFSRFVTGHVIPTDGGTLAAGGWFRTVDRGRWTNRPRNP